MKSTEEKSMKLQEDRKCTSTYHVTLSRLHVIIVDVDKQYILSVYVSLVRGQLKCDGTR
jgi:hypothetical protein